MRRYSGQAEAISKMAACQAIIRGVVNGWDAINARCVDGLLQRCFESRHLRTFIVIGCCLKLL